MFVSFYYDELLGNDYLYLFIRLKFNGEYTIVN